MVWIIYLPLHHDFGIIFILENGLILIKPFIHLVTLYKMRTFMELFIRRRWKLVSVQLVSWCVKSITKYRNEWYWQLFPLVTRITETGTAQSCLSYCPVNCIENTKRGRDWPICNYGYNWINLWIKFWLTSFLALANISRVILFRWIITWHWEIFLDWPCHGWSTRARQWSGGGCWARFWY